jgi:hypothetical protein
MKITFCCLIFLLNLLNPSFGFCEENKSSLKLVISSITDDKNKNSITEVKIINTGNQYVAFDQNIFFENNIEISVPHLPLSELRFYIDKGKGFERLMYNPGTYYPSFSRSDPNKFLILGPNYIWGLEINLGEHFNCNFLKGNYRIKAVFENRSRSWMYKYFNKTEISQMHIDESKIFDGIIESNILYVEIGR